MPVAVQPGNLPIGKEYNKIPYASKRYFSNEFI